MKIEIRLTGQATAPDYPLSILAEMLADLSDELFDVERRWDVDVPFPIQKTVKGDDDDQIVAVVALTGEGGPE